MKSFKIVILLSILMMNEFFVYSQDVEKYFVIQIIDNETGRGVPQVELKTVNNLLYVTDNNGIIAFYEPGLMNTDVYFHIKSHGYEYPKDGFGYHGKSLKTVSGGNATIRIKRINIAERLYRITGQGLYNYSQIAGVLSPLKQPLISGKVMGQDTFIETQYNGKIYWFWGDTDKPSYPLGNFSTSGATSELPGKGGLDPSQGIDLDYFTDHSGFSKKMCPVPGPGPVWMHWLATIRNSMNSERLIGSYTRVKSLSEQYEQGLAVFNNSSEIFEPFFRFELHSPFFPDGQSFRITVNGREYIYFDFSNRYPMRVPADLKHIKDLSSYESFTCLKEGSRFDTIHNIIERSANGKPVYSWKKNTEPLNIETEKYLLKKGELKPGETFYNLCDFLTGGIVIPKSSSVFWNEYRQKWIMIFEQIYGTSFMGEVWYAEGDTPTGPWVYTRKVVTHDNYTFYNVGQHPLFDQEKGRFIYFEGTYTNSFSGNPIPTPLYNYNQIMYGLDLRDSRLYMPSPVYRIKDSGSKLRYVMHNEIDSLWDRLEEIPFFALQNGRSIEGSIPVYEFMEKNKLRLSQNKPGMKSKPLFYGLPETVFADSLPDGKWECRADEYLLEMELRFDGEKVQGRISNESMIIRKGARMNDSIELIIEDTTALSTYIVKAQLSGSKLNGAFKDIKTKEAGAFSGKQITGLPGFSSSMIVPLFEFRDNKGFYSYSLKSEQEGLKRTEKPLCRVWINPSSVLQSDYLAKPVPVNK